jgi:thiol:disulfide interchange protein DsbA
MSYYRVFYCGWLLGLSLITSVAFANSPCDTATWVEGKHYQLLPMDIVKTNLVESLTEAYDQVQVLEFFSYGCYWCKKLEGSLSNWLAEKPDEVAFQRVPVVFQPAWAYLARAYYTAQQLEVLNEIHPKLFAAVQEQHLTPINEETLQAFFEAEQGISAQAFHKAFHAFAMERQLKWANDIAQAYKISAIPVVIVQNSEQAYMTTVKMAGSESALFEVINTLTKKLSPAL